MTRRKKILLWTGGVVGGVLVLAVGLGLAVFWLFSSLGRSATWDERALRDQWRSPFPDQAPPAVTVSEEKAFGSGHFGDWITDRFGLPAYAYTCDQLHDPKARTPVNPTLQSPTNHWHQLGNDRIVAIASNEGYVQLRQDEGAPKLLNDFDPKRGKLAGGIGFLTDGEHVLSTLYPGNAESFERIFGVGYFEKRVAGHGLVVDQVVFAPFGDDPLLVSRVEIENRRPQAAELRWVESWDSTQHQLSYRSFLLSVLTGLRAPATELRRELAAAFSHDIRVWGDGRALVDEQRFRGYPWRHRVAWAVARRALPLLGGQLAARVVPPPVPEVSFDDLGVTRTFLASLDAPADGFGSSGVAFLGEGGVVSPDGLARPLSDHAPSSDGSTLLVERRLRLDPGGKKTLHFAFGYLPSGVELDDLLEGYQGGLDGLWETSSHSWAGQRISLRLPEEEWVDRELLWHNYYLRSNTTFDDFFGEPILSQGHVYQYTIGFQGAARDPLQHALPFIYTHPALVKGILRYTLKEVGPDGSIPYGIVGHGMIMPARNEPSDQQLWLLWLASEYVLATRDTALLDEEIPAYPLYGDAIQRTTVKALLERCYRHFVEVTGTGKHGLARLSNGDWNDGAVIGFVPDDQVEAVRESGESVLNAAFATYVLDLYARMLEAIGDSELAAASRRRAEEQREAVRRQWTGEWYRRQWLTEELGWVGDDVLWLEPQPWAILGGAAPAEHQAVLVESMDRLLRQPSPIGAIVRSQPREDFRVPPGVLTNAGIWPSINGTLVWALARVDGRLGWDEWKKNTLAWHAESYPDVWYGIWSGPDAYNSVLAAHPGETHVQTRTPERGDEKTLNWTDFPVMNMHPHAWPLYDVPKLLGIEFTVEGVDIAPTLPQETYEFSSPLLGLRRSAAGYSGWYAPLAAGTWEIRLTLPFDEAAGFSMLRVNGVALPLASREDGPIRIRGDSRASEPLRWQLE